MFNNLELALGMALKAMWKKELKLIVRKFWGLILKFVEDTEVKLVGGFLSTHPPSLSIHPILNNIEL